MLSYSTYTSFRGSLRGLPFCTARAYGFLLNSSSSFPTTCRSHLVKARYLKSLVTLPEIKKQIFYLASVASAMSANPWLSDLGRSGVARICTRASSMLKGRQSMHEESCSTVVQLMPWHISWPSGQLLHISFSSWFAFLLSFKTPPATCRGRRKHQ